MLTMLPATTWAPMRAAVVRSHTPSSLWESRLMRRLALNCRLMKEVLRGGSMILWTRCWPKM